MIFVKAPRAGFVKTRLAQTVGAETALETYLGLVEVLVTNLADLPSVDLHFAPADAWGEIEPWLADQWTSSPQCDGDLGARLIHAFESAFSKRAKRVVVIGSDCPYATTEDIRDAFHQLAENDVVLGPAVDGGYWLVGLRSPAPELFRDINWSTETVLEDTLAKAKARELNVAQLRELSDVDTIADLMRFQEWCSSQA